MAKFTVCVPGLLTTVQDRGRMGYAASGFSPSGVMDRRAFSLGNLLVGNAANAPAIEFAFAGPTLEFETDAVVAITGADFNPRLDEERAPMYQAFVVRAGQRSQCRPPSAAYTDIWPSPTAAWMCPASWAALPPT